MKDDREITGNVSVGKSVVVGRNATIRGRMDVDHNLRVKGYLEAPNIKDCNKGMFASYEKLCETYPRAERGWWAFVGDCFPAKIYVWDGNVWKDTGQTGGDPQIDFTPVIEFEERLDALEENVEGLTNRADSTDGRVEAVERSLSQLVERTDSAEERLASVEKKASEIGSAVNAIEPRLTAAERSIDVLQADMQTITSTVETTSDRVGDIEQGITALSGELHQSNEQINSVVREVISLGEQCDSINGDVSSMREELSVQRTSLDSATQRLVSIAETIDTVTPVVSDLSEGVKDLRDVADTHSLRIGELQNEVALLKSCDGNGSGIRYLRCDGIADTVSGVEISEQNLSGSQDVQTVWDRSRKRFILLVKDDSYDDYSNCDYCLEWGGKEALDGPYTECVLLCGERAYMFVSGDWDEVITSSRLDEVESRVNNRFVGVWDEFDDMKELLLGVSTNEVQTLLSRLGYDEKDIEEYIWANLHLQLGITLEQLRYSVNFWESKNEYNLGGSRMVVFPKCTNEADIEWLFTGAEYSTTGSFVRYSSLRGVVKYVPFIDYDISYEKFITLMESSLYMGGFEVSRVKQGYTSPWTSGFPKSSSSSILGIGRIENSTGIRIYLSYFDQLRYLGSLSEGSYVTATPNYMFDFRGLNECSLSNSGALAMKITGVTQVARIAQPERETLLPETIRVYQVMNGYQEIARVFDGRLITGGKIKVEAQKAGNGTNLFQGCLMEEVDIHFDQNISKDYLAKTMGVSGIESGRSSIHFSNGGADLDLTPLYSRIQYTRGNPAACDYGVWDVYCPQIMSVEVASPTPTNESFQHTILLWNFGGSDEAVLVDYTNMWSPATITPENYNVSNPTVGSELLQDLLVESIRSWADRSGKVPGNVQFSYAQIVWITERGIFDEIDELLFEKNYSLLTMD